VCRVCECGGVLLCEFFAGHRVTAVGPADLVVSAGECVGVFCIRFVRCVCLCGVFVSLVGEAVWPLGGVCVAGYSAGRWGEFCVCVLLVVPLFVEGSRGYQVDPMSDE